MIPDSTSAHDRVHILSRAFDSWVVEFRIAVEELLDQQQLLRHLRGVKHSIAHSQSVPESCLIFDGILRKNREADWVDVVVRIKKRLVESGAPSITFREAYGADGTSYASMVALLDLYYLDEFEQVITQDRVMRAVREAGVSLDLVDQTLIMQKLAEVAETQLPARAVPIASGRLPDIGSDAEIEFFFKAVSESLDVDVLYSARRVKRGDLLCRKTPASDGLNSGINVLGQILPPRPGLDISILAGENTSLSLDGRDIVADTDGVVVVSRTNRTIRFAGGTKEFPESVSVKVNPVMVLEGAAVIDMATSLAVEVSGNLRVGSRIVSDSEVFVSGDVEEGASVTAADNILVKGNVRGATLSSQGSICTGQSVSGSSLQAQGDISIAGDVSDSSLVGDSINARTARSSRMVARTSATLERIGTDEGEVMSTICVGMREFYTQRLLENQKFLETAYANLDRIKMIIGEEVFNLVTSTNTQTMLMRFLSLSHVDVTSKTRQQVDVYRKLIEAIPPTRALAEQKERECVEIARRIADPTATSEGSIVIRESVANRAVISVNGIRSAIGETQGELKIRTAANEIAFQPDREPEA